MAGTKTLFGLHAVELTDAMCDAIEALGRAQRTYVPGHMSAAIVEIPKLALADATLAAIRAQLVRLQATGRTSRLARVPRGKPVQVPVVDLELRRKRKA